MGSARSRKKPAGKKSSKQQESSSNRTILYVVLGVAGVAVLGVLLWLGLRPEPEIADVVTSWGVQLEVDDIGDDRVSRFVDRYRLGPNTPELGAACTNGIGEPIG